MLHVRPSLSSSRLSSGRLAAALLLAILLAGGSTAGDTATSQQAPSKEVKPAVSTPDKEMARVKPMEALPSPSFAQGWRMDGPVQQFDPKTIFQYIDGEAELYFPYGFTWAVTARYLNEGDPAFSIQADVYEMGSLLDAFGVYSNYLYKGANRIELGGDGYANDTQAMFYQGRYFVRLMAIGDKAKTPAALQACATAIASRLPGAGQPSARAVPKELSLLQGLAGLTPRSEKYIAQSVLGYAFFAKGFTAEAKLDGKPARILIVLTDSPQAASAAFDAYTTHLKEKKAEFTSDGADGLVARDPLYKGAVVKKAGKCVVGVAGLTDPSAGAALASELATRAAAY